MKIFVPKETHPGETRVPLIPDTVNKLVKLGAEIEIETGMGLSTNYPDKDYVNVGAKVEADRQQALSSADMVLRLRKPPIEEIKLLKQGCIHVSHLDPFRETALVQEMVQCAISAISMEMMPRITVAQKMDVLSSQANLAGYVAVILAAERLDRIFPMMMTAAGTLAPARVLIIGVGVAGLQAIATAKRLGARVEAFDVRPVVEEQVRSLGAKFVKIDIGETGETKGGYAKPLTPEQLEMQRKGLAKHCAAADVVITTAQLFGRPAPRVVTEDMVAGMKPGSIIVDLAVETGGNVAGSKVDEEVIVGGVRIIGLANLPGRVAVHASQMYSTNIGNLVEHFWDREARSFKLDLEDEIMKGCLITHANEICNEMVRKILK